jgi:hypothetical protein
LTPTHEDRDHTGDHWGKDCRRDSETLSRSAKRLVNTAVPRYADKLQEGLSWTIDDDFDVATPGTRSTNEGGGPTTFIRDRILGVASPQPVPDPTPIGRFALALP